MRKIIDFLTSYFKTDNDIITGKLIKLKYNYELLKDVTMDLIVVDGDIIKANSIIEKIIKYDFLEDIEIPVPNITEASYKKVRLLYWATDDLTKLSDLDKEIKRFINLSNDLINKFNALKFKNPNGNFYKYNIRRLQPYIINIVEIRKSLLLVCDRG